MVDETKDPPLEVLPDGGCYVGVVVDLDEVRIRVGRTPYKVKSCKHLHLIYCSSERRVWCEDCERTIDNFDAFSILTNKFEAMLREANGRLATATEALNSAARLRATKTLDRMWSGGRMAPCCPHCNRGLLPEDFMNGARSAVGTEFEKAQRARKADDR